MVIKKNNGKTAKQKRSTGVIKGRYDLTSDEHKVLEKFADADNRSKKPFVENLLRKFMNGEAGEYYNELNSKIEA